MKIIYGRAASGKTTELIKIAGEQFLYIVARDTQSVMSIKRQSEIMELDIPMPITYRAFINRDFNPSPRGIQGFLIDDADALLEAMAGQIPVLAITVSEESKPLTPLGEEPKVMYHENKGLLRYPEVQAREPLPMIFTDSLTEPTPELRFLLSGYIKDGGMLTVDGSINLYGYAYVHREMTFVNGQASIKETVLLPDNVIEKKDEAGRKYGLFKDENKTNQFAYFFPCYQERGREHYEYIMRIESTDTGIKHLGNENPE